ncbi:hypothetical protein KIN20_036752 [Parelaphostrongylus tenuis]|uniref:Laminin G domain-containing protein n=1 Tax=Parelaphostrongylus tenuis TaxID=148309 RepID=A0AAD5WLG0_PARTN|nr:hypothetical protein KIN20_036752 [Parelaphostrongylus tenuis]
MDRRFAAVGFVREGVQSVAIARISASPEEGMKCRIGGRAIKRDFFTVFRWCANIGHDHSSNRAEVFVDADFERSAIPTQVNATAILANTAAEFDLGYIATGAVRACSFRKEERFEVSSTCRFIVKQPIDSEQVMASISDVSVGVTLRSLQISKRLLQSVLQLVFYATSIGVAEFLSALQQMYSDMIFYPLAIDVVGHHRNTLALAILDRNHRTVSAQDALSIVQKFLKLTEYPHVLVESMKASLCSKDLCANDGKCRQAMSFSSTRVTFYGFNSIWNVPNGIITTRCECSHGYCGRTCDVQCDTPFCSTDRCSTNGRSIQACETFRVGGGCLTGFSEAICSMQSDNGQSLASQSIDVEALLEHKQKSLCVRVNCGDGVCHVHRGQPVCQCSDGLKATDCSIGSQVISLSNVGFITLIPTEQLRIQPFNHSLLSNDDFCNGSQSLAIEFRTRESYGTIVVLSYELEYSVIEMHGSVVRYRVINPHRAPIDITLDRKSVNDGEWHHVMLELTSDRKTITFRMDDIGKQALSREMLPALISAELESIHFGQNGPLGQFTGCLRRLVINGRLQPLLNDQKHRDELFSTVDHGVVAKCVLDSAHKSILQNTTVVSYLVVIAVPIVAIVLVIVVLHILRRKVANDSKQCGQMWTRNDVACRRRCK